MGLGEVLKQAQERVKNPDLRTRSLTVYFTGVLSITVQGIAVVAHTWVLIILTVMGVGQNYDINYYTTLLLFCGLYVYVMNTFINSVRDFNEARQQDRYFRERM